MCFCSNSFMFIPVSKRCRLLLFPESGLNKKVTQHNKVGCLGKIKGDYKHEISPDNLILRKLFLFPVVGHG